MSEEHTSSIDSDESAENLTASLGGKYLTFKLAAEEYGLQILKVREIIALIDITHIPKAPPYILGVINLRGKIIPVVSLRVKFGMEPIEHSSRTCIIVMDFASEGRHTAMGILVDTVSAVLDIESQDIEPTPEYTTNVRSEFIIGMGKVEEEVKILLDIDEVLTEKDREEIKQAGTHEA